MKKILQLTKAVTLILSAVIMLSSTNVLTAHAQLMLPGMTKTEYGIMLPCSASLIGTDTKTGTKWGDQYDDRTGRKMGYPYCDVTKTITVIKVGKPVASETSFLDCYLTDYIKEHDESEWPSFIIKGSDGVPFYYSKYGTNNSNKDHWWYTKWCYDETTGWWLEDKSYKGPEVTGDGFASSDNPNAVKIEDLIEETKTSIENGEIINGEAVDPIPPNMDGVIDSESPDAPTWGLDDNDKDDEEPTNPPTEGDEIKDPYADVNTLGATVTLKTDCIKVKKNNAAQKPLPKSVKIGKTSLKRNKTFTVSYEKYTDGWNTVNAITDKGIYRLVLTGQNGYEGVYKKRLWVTADKTVKAMSSVSVKVNKMYYTGEPIISGVIKTAKIGKRTLTEGIDYTVTYRNNTETGTAQVILTAKEDSGLLGTKTVNFKICENKLNKAKVTGINSVTYSPENPVEQDMSKVKLTYNGKELTENTDFTVTYKNNTKAGTAKITFTGCGIYNGTLTKSFKITKAPLKADMLDEASKNIEEAYTGRALTPDVTIKNGNTTLKKGTDYTLAYKNNVKASTDAKPAQIIVKGKGSYTGTFTVQFSIIDRNNDNIEKSNTKNIKTDTDELTEEPVADEPTEDEPTEDEPVTDEPTADEPVTDEPTEDNPVADEPTEDEPAVDEPTADEPVADKPVTDEPVADKPVADEPTEDEPVADEPTEDKPVADEPTADEPVADKPVTDEPVADKPVTDEPTEDKPATDKPAIDVPVADESTLDAPATYEYTIVDIDAETALTAETTEQ